VSCTGPTPPFSKSTLPCHRALGAPHLESLPLLRDNGISKVKAGMAQQVVTKHQLSLRPAHGSHVQDHGGPAPVLTCLSVKGRSWTMQNTSRRGSHVDDTGGGTEVTQRGTAVQSPTQTEPLQEGEI
jgi:hypothetical protein